MLLIQEIQFLAPISVYRLYTSVDEVYFEAQETYQKRSIRNKCIILGANGPLTLTVPLTKGKHTSQSITEVEISYHDSWVGDLLHAIRSCYGASPYFEYYYPQIESIFRIHHTHLWALNEALLKLMLLNGNFATLPIKYTKSYIKEYGSEWIDIRSKKLKDYQPKVNDSANELAQGYAQVFEDRYGFVDDLSILDAIFCLGPETSYYLGS